ncbi:hypothetical protein OG884_08165 [Streptosporangium sp. NBC_01755]|nr:hypothetical protein OIE13_01995 [Streptosporangium sp. NBC_01810]WSD04310.1 hypothetical protein OG884_08165 [Streptosporangium sp. NBC_01755]
MLLDLSGGTLAAVGGAHVYAVAPAAGDRPGWATARAVLIRPDGYVGWASEEPDDAALAKSARAMLH